MEAIAARLFRQATGQTPKSLTRFPVGLCHYVYQVTTADDEVFVLRLATAANREILKGGRYWLGQLERLDLPIPRIVHDGTDGERPFLILNYLPGADLGTVYTTLTEPQKQRIATAVCAIQRQVATLPHHRGYGHLRSWDATDYETGWQDVIERHIARSLAGIRHHRIFTGDYGAPLRAMLPAFSRYFASIRPVAFLDDATSKNVLVADGRLSGIVDIDCLCFGDRLYFIALTRMSLLQSGHDTSYIDYLADGFSLDAFQRKVLDLYTLVFCLDFMAEIGETYNKNEPLSVSDAEKERMTGIFDMLVEKLKT